MKKIIGIILGIMLITSNAFCGIDFDDTDDFINCGSGSTIDNVKPITVSAWIYQDLNGGAIWASDTSSIAGYFFGTEANQTISFFGDWVGGNNLYRLSNNTSVPLDAWTHALMTWDGSTTASNIHIYINGTEVSYQTTTNATGTAANDAAGNKMIGGDSEGTTFDGEITEVAVWNVVLSAAQIAQLASSRLKGIPLQLADPDADGTQELVLYVPMDDQETGTAANGVTIRDQSGNSNSGTGDNGANNTGLLFVGESVLSYPSGIIGGQ